MTNGRRLSRDGVKPMLARKWPFWILDHLSMYESGGTMEYPVLDKSTSTHDANPLPGSHSHRERYCGELKCKKPSDVRRDTAFILDPSCVAEVEFFAVWQTCARFRFV